MALNPSRRLNKNKKESIYREIGGNRFIGIRTINELEDIIDTSEAFMTNPTVIFNKDDTKVIFYYNTRNKNEIEEMETLFKRTVKKGSTITLSDASYLNESSGDDETYDISGTYKFESYDIKTKTIVAIPITMTKQSSTYSTYDKQYWLGSLLWTTSDPITTKHTSYEIVNFLGNRSENSFLSTFGTLKENDRIEIKGVGTYTIREYKKDGDKGWERVVVKEEIPEKDLLGEMTYIRVLRSDRNQTKPSNEGTIPSIEPPEPSVRPPLPSVRPPKPSVRPPNRSQRGRGTEDGQDRDKCKECYNDGSGFPYDNREQKACEKRCVELFSYDGTGGSIGKAPWDNSPLSPEDIQAADRYAGCLKKCGCQSCNWKPECHIACWGGKAAKKFKCECRYIWGCASMMSDGCNPVHVPEDECNANPYYEWVPATDDHPGYCQWLEIVDL